MKKALYIILILFACFVAFKAGYYYVICNSDVYILDNMYTLEIDNNLYMYDSIFVNGGNNNV